MVASEEDVVVEMQGPTTDATSAAGEDIEHETVHIKSCRNLASNMNVAFIVHEEQQAIRFRQYLQTIRAVTSMEGSLYPRLQAYLN